MSDRVGTLAAPDEQSRLAPFSPVDLTPAQRSLYDAILNSPRGTRVNGDGHLPGPFNAMLLSPPVGDALQALGAAIRFESYLPPLAVEMAILTVATTHRSEYEWSRHSQIALRLGANEAQLAAIRDAAELPPPTSAVEALVVDATRRLLAQRDLSDEEFARAKAHLGEAGVFEVSTIVGYYSTIALQLRLFRVPVG